MKSWEATMCSSAKLIVFEYGLVHKVNRIWRLALNLPLHTTEGGGGPGEAARVWVIAARLWSRVLGLYQSHTKLGMKYEFLLPGENPHSVTAHKQLYGNYLCMNVPENHSSLTGKSGGQCYIKPAKHFIIEKMVSIADIELFQRFCSFMCKTEGHFCCETHLWGRVRWQRAWRRDRGLNGGKSEALSYVWGREHWARPTACVWVCSNGRTWLGLLGEYWLAAWLGGGVWWCGESWSCGQIWDNVFLKAAILIWHCR